MERTKETAKLRANLALVRLTGTVDWFAEAKEAVVLLEISTLPDSTVTSAACLLNRLISIYLREPTLRHGSLVSEMADLVIDLVIDTTCYQPTGEAGK